MTEAGALASLTPLWAHDTAPVGPLKAPTPHGPTGHRVPTSRGLRSLREVPGGRECPLPSLVLHLSKPSGLLEVKTRRWFCLFKSKLDLIFHDKSFTST